MIRFEVTGATPEEFAENAMKAWGLLALGLRTVLTPPSSPGPDCPPSSTQSTPSEKGIPSTSTQPSKKSTEAPTAEMLGSESSSSASKVPSDRMDDLFMEKKEAAGPTPMDGSSRQTKKSDGLKSAKGPKLDDLKTRLSEVIVAATERWDQKRANAYARKLLKTLGVEKLGDLKPENYADFFDLSENFVSGVYPE